MAKNNFSDSLDNRESQASIHIVKDTIQAKEIQMSTLLIFAVAVIVAAFAQVVLNPRQF